MNYVDKEKFLDWYRSTALEPMSELQVLKKLYSDYSKSGEKEFCLSAEESKSGKAESYKFEVEHIGCCGASTVYIYF